MIYAVDFDGTLMIGNNEPNMRLFDFLKNEQRHGNAVILNTCRHGKSLVQAVRFCLEHGLQFQTVNANLPYTIKMLGYDPRKIFADVYIDDKASRP